MVRQGSIGIVQDGEKFDVTFARYDWSGAMRAHRVYGREALTHFLEGKLGLAADVVHDALHGLDQNTSAHVPGVSLSDERRLSLGMVAPSEVITF